MTQNRYTYLKNEDLSVENLKLLLVEIEHLAIALVNNHNHNNQRMNLSIK